MYMMARLYPTDEQARAAAAAFVAAGYSSDDIAVLSSQTTEAAKSVETARGEGESAAAAEQAPSANDMANAVRVGGMLGARAEFYISQLTDGRSLVVATPPFIASRMAEQILDEHHPLAISHLPSVEPFVPVSEKATPFSDMLGMPTLIDGPVFSNLLGFNTSQEGLSHFSRLFAPLNSGFKFSSLLGMGLLTDSATPLSSMANISTRSDRGEGKTSSFGMSLSTERAAPFSSLLGLPLLSKRKHFLVW